MENAEIVQKEVEQPCTNPPENSEIKNTEVPSSSKSKENIGVGTKECQTQQQQPVSLQSPTTPPLSQQPQPQQQQVPVNRTRSSREGKMRKKDDKSVDHVLKALNSLNTTEEKLAAMCKKYADIFDENRKIQLALKQAEKRCSTLQRETEQLQGDHSKAILTRSRLENLCRELQRQNKAIKDESLLKIREEEEKRKEVSAKFQATLNEITALMQQNNDKNMKLRDDNIDMNAKLKNVCEQYELREQQVEKISKQMQLEAQLADAKLAKAKMEMAAEREIMLREKQQLLLELSQYQARCQEFQATEINLRNQISMYDDKYDEFQKALARSNEVFGGFKGEMEKMSKKMCKLEKEVSTWKQRWEGSHKALLEMAEEKQKTDQELSHSNRQFQTLQRLCRTLQSERASLLAKLKVQQTSSDVKNENAGSTIGGPGDDDMKQDQLINGDLLQSIDTSNEIPQQSDNVNVVDSKADSSIASSIRPTASTCIENINAPVSDSCVTQPVENIDPKVQVSVDATKSSSVIVDNTALSAVASTIGNVVLQSSDSPAAQTGGSTLPPINSDNVTDVVVKNTSDPLDKAVNVLLQENPAVPLKDVLPPYEETSTLIEPCAIASQTADKNEAGADAAAVLRHSQGDAVVVEHNGIEETKQSSNSLSSESKQKPNTIRSVKKQNNETKKGKECKKKKKNNA